MLRSALDKPIISWEEFDRIFNEAFNPSGVPAKSSVSHDGLGVVSSVDEKEKHKREDSLASTNTVFSTIPRAASPEPILSDASLDADSFAGFISEEEIPKIYTPLAFPTTFPKVGRKESSDSLRSETKASSVLSSSVPPKSVVFPKRPRVMSNQISSRRTISSAGSVPRVKRTKTKPRVQMQTTPDGSTTTVIDVPDILKDSINVDFHHSHLVVTWRTATVTEQILRDSMVREKKEKRYTQTIIVPEGTKYEDVRATLKRSQLTISFPSNPKLSESQKTSSP
ncbi:SubName: Full=Uncharacterized protein {ECO:0000313/EMBL:CCA68906.1} [Serendipita indica DSM 11827]|uniref:SHSP domain-containing protein n=1 Tax=Serendipita indica (strain DSM 11827) TaxID=1109443 RepID=G4TC50_SERID|nr:SubName: Full=Uncharacterized protein {ECO:0000313/EMBL:CCA68906.1} [Serendipita indica DSM 11827]CCA68906.1 hypothetical protein PIIN_02766 [Serendipita indica DSM 11827]